MFACSSSSVPICPGRMSSGGANSTGALSSASPIGTAWCSPVGLPITWSTWEPAVPPVASSAPDERDRRRRSRRGRARPDRRGSPGWRRTRGRRSTLLEHRLRLRHGPLRQADHDRDAAVRAEARLPRTAPARRRTPSAVTGQGRALDPWKHATCVMSAGACTRTVARSIGADHSVADRVPVELVVVAEAVQRRLDRVVDLVGVPAGDVSMSASPTLIRVMPPAADSTS